MHVLFVCTGNMCRSPMAAALFDRCHAQAVETGVAEPGALSVSSAGLLDSGHESPPEVAQVMAELGIDLHGHRSMEVSADMVSSADLVVGMGRRHAREVVLLDAGAFSRAFTLKDLVHRGDLVGPRNPGESLQAWTNRLYHGRQRTDLVGDSDADDVPDPLGGSLDDFRATAHELADLAERLVGLLWASRRMDSASG